MTTTQITVRIPDDLVQFIDRTVADENATGRAAIIARALERERRRMAAAHDAKIYAAVGDTDDLDDLVTYASRQPMDVA